jgi:chemotaxis response regulator CheB
VGAAALPVVALVSSAGGLAAMSKVFAPLPAAARPDAPAGT